MGDQLDELLASLAARLFIIFALLYFVYYTATNKYN